MGEAKLRMKSATPTASTKRFHADFAALLKRHLAEEQADVLLAVASYAVGQLVAMQDQRRITPAMAMEIVSKNLEAGNAAAIEALCKSEGNA